MNQYIRILLPKINLLPELLQIVFYYYFDGPYILTYHPQTNSFIYTINSNFVLLNNANLFKISNPPSFHMEQDSDDEEYLQCMLLTFKYPLYLSSSHQDYEYSQESNLILNFIYKFKYDVSSQLLLTYQCQIIIPMYYHSILDMSSLYFQFLFNSNLKNKYSKQNLKNYIYAFQIKTYASDVYIC